MTSVAAHAPAPVPFEPIDSARTEASMAQEDDAFNVPGKSPSTASMGAASSVTSAPIVREIAPSRFSQPESWALASSEAKEKASNLLHTMLRAAHGFEKRFLATSNGSVNIPPLATSGGAALQDTFTASSPMSARSEVSARVLYHRRREMEAARGPSNNSVTDMSSVGGDDVFSSTHGTTEDGVSEATGGPLTVTTQPSTEPPFFSDGEAAAQDADFGDGASSRYRDADSDGVGLPSDDDMERDSDREEDEASLRGLPKGGLTTGYFQTSQSIATPREGEQVNRDAERMLGTRPLRNREQVAKHRVAAATAAAETRAAASLDAAAPTSKPSQAA
ncbi:MAG: hypothetical protein EOO41_05700, partial [Methanobacteriota archaeon]